MKWFPANPGMFSSLPGRTRSRSVRESWLQRPLHLMQSCFPFFIFLFFLPTNASLSCLTDCACPGGVFVLTPHLRDSQLPQCIITIPSGQWKRHAVMWKGNYLWWNFLKHIRNRGRREKRKVRVRKWWWGVWKMQLSPPRTSQQVNRRFAMIWYSSAGGRWRHTEWYSDGFSTAVSLSLAHFGSCKWTFIHPPIYLLFISFFWCCKQHPFLC